MLPLAAVARTKRPMTFEDLQAIKRIADPQVSASGKWVMFSVTEVDLAANKKTTHLWTVSIDGKVAERKITDGKGESNGRFSPDGKQVLFISSNGGSSQIWLAPWDDKKGEIGKPRQFTSVSTEADGAVWAPDSKSIAFVSDVYPECEPTQRFDDACNKTHDEAAEKSPVKAMIFDSLLYRHWDHYQGAKRSHILLVSATDAKSIRDLTPTRDIGNHVAPTYGQSLAAANFSPDGKELAYTVNLDKDPSSSTNNDIYTLQLNDENAKPVKITTSPGSDDSPAYSLDDRYIAYRSQVRGGYESDRFRLMLYDRIEKSAKDLLPKFDGWIDEFAWDQSIDSQRIYFTFENEGRRKLGLALRDGQTAGTPIGGLDSLQLSLATNLLIGTFSDVDHPATIVAAKVSEIPDPRPGFGWARFDFAWTQTLTPNLNSASSASVHISGMEPFWFPSTDQTKVQGFIIRPPNFDPTKKYPLKFLIHGGPQGAWGDAWSYRWNPELFAANGYVVVMINPRGSTGYGQKFIDGVNGNWGGQPYQDLMTGLDFAEKKYPFIDKTRECALGASYGGFMANWILTHTSRFACIVTHDGMYNPESAYGSTEEMWFNEWEFRKQTKDAKGNTHPATAPAQPWVYAKGPDAQNPFRKWSPMLNIEKAKTPTLVIHGQKDYRLDVSEGFQLFTALQRLGVPSKMLYFPDEGHWVLKPQNSKLWYETVNDWCDKWTHTNKYAQ